VRSQVHLIWVLPLTYTSQTLKNQIIFSKAFKYAFKNVCIKTKGKAITSKGRKLCIEQYRFFVYTGIGRELCKTLASYPSPPTVIAVSKTNANLESLKAECPSIITVQVDLTDWTATRSALASLLPIHCLVNNAAANICQPFLEVTPDTFDSYDFTDNSEFSDQVSY